MNGGKNKMYKTIYDLNRAELNELKDEMLFAHFGGISFVEEDFMCNI